MPNRVLLALVIGVCAGIALAQTTITLRPTADGSVKQWNNNAGAACTGTTCYTQVAETTGTTNCTGSSFVKGDGTYNKSPATTAQVEQYSLTLSSIPDNSIIQSITVWTCQARGGSQSTAGTLRIVLNGGTTTCGATQSATAVYNPYSCVFGSLNVTKGSGTTLQIGNATTQGRAIWMDAISAQVTYVQQASSPVTAAFGTSDAVTGVKHTNVPQVGNVTGAFGSSPACCVTSISPLGASFHVSPAVMAARSTSVNACCIVENPHIDPVCSTCISKNFDTAHFTISPTVVAFKSALPASVTGAFGVSPAVTRSAGKHAAAAASFANSPATASVHSSFGSVSQSFNTVVAIGVSSTHIPQNAQREVDTGFGTATQVDEIGATTTSASASAHFSPTVSGKANLSKSFTATIAFSVGASAFQRQPKGKFVVMVTH